ncbi:hypothetical protein ACIHFC_01005 [Streptomyces sp. NPDC052013]|uniref:hypothetical protein n=1 Tax=Streptomyces sp. NPDC052013 TaxID=3365679 RepID=UPI0037D244D6
MDLEKSAAAPHGDVPAAKDRDAPAAEGCLVVALRIPLRIVVLVLVVPVRMVWDALVVAGRFLNDTVFRPLGRAALWGGRALFVWPFVGLWRYLLVPLGRGLAWLGKVLVVVPAGWAYRNLLTPLGHVLLWVYARVLTPVGHGVLWVLRGVGAVLAALGLGTYAALAWLARYLVVVPAVWLYAWVLTPVGHAIAWCARGVVWVVTTVVTGVGLALYWITRVLFVLPALAVWRWVLVPVGRVLAVVGREILDALGHAWRIAGHISLAVGRFLGTLFRWIFVEPVRWVYRSVLTPIGHAVRDTVLRPAARAARSVGRATREALASARESVRQARADFRRMLFGEPRQPQLANRREPPARETRTLGSSTTALTKD